MEAAPQNDPPPEEDARIVANLKSGHPDGAKALVRQYGTRLLRSAFLLCQNEDDAQDLVQETLIVAIKAVARYEGKSALYTWLHGILLNQSRHYRRAKARKKMVFTDRLLDERMEGLQAAVTQKIMQEASVLADCLRKLSPAHREVIILRFFENMKLEDIARQLGVNSSTIRSRLRFALKRLKKFLPNTFNEIPL